MFRLFETSVIHDAQQRIAQCFVCAMHSHETIRGARRWIEIRMEALGEITVCALDLRVRGGACDAKCDVVIAPHVRDQVLCIPSVLRIVKVERMIRSVRYVALGCVLLVASSAHAQGQVIRIVVLDSLDDRPIPEVQVSLGENMFTTTDVDGRCLLAAPGVQPLHVHLEHVSYRTAEFVFDGGARKIDGEYVVRLARNDRVLTAAVVIRPKPEPIFQRSDLHAADLLINDQGLWVLAYEHPRMLRAEGEAREEILRGVRLVLLDSTYAEVASVAVPEEVKGLRRDLRNDVVIEGSDHAYSVRRTADVIVLEPFGLDELRKSVLPWTDSVPGWVLGSNADQVMPAFDHLAFDPVTDSARVVCTVVDTFMMQLFRSEYKYMSGRDKVLAMNLADELNVDKEIVAGYMSGFQHNIWFKPVYAPLFVVGDTLLVFDHARGRLRKFTRTFASAGEAPLTYLSKGERRDWAKRILQDRRTHRLYAVFARYARTWLCSVDPVTGKLGERSSITYPYPERLQVFGDAAYYVYRPYESLQKRTIYRELIR